MQPASAVFPLPAGGRRSCTIQRCAPVCGAERPGGPMLRQAVAFAAALAAGSAASGTRAQDGDAGDALTAEEMIEVARAEWRSPRLRGCPEARPDEIVVCHEDEENFRVESSLDEAIREGRPVRDGVPRTPYVLELPECGVEVVCHRIGRAPEPPLMIDLSALPVALTPEEAAHVYRAEDLPAAAASPEAASPAAAP